MSFLRFVARSLLASHFVINGVKAVKDPTPFVPAVEPLAERIVPIAQQVAPAQVGDRIPTDTATLVRISGGAQVLGGLAFATGKGRRLGATLLAVTLIPETIAAHPFWTRTDPEEKAADKAHFLKNLGLLGGVLLASVDTEGRPSLGYRAQAGAQALSKDAGKAKKKAEKALSRSSHHGRDVLDEVIAEGAKALESVLQESRKSGKKASKAAQKTAKQVARDFEDAKEKAAKQAKAWEKDAEKAAKQARKTAAKTADRASKKVSDASSQASKKAAKVADTVTDKVSDGLDHIELGTN